MSEKHVNICLNYDGSTDTYLQETAGVFLDVPYWGKKKLLRKTYRLIETQTIKIYKQCKKGG